jgi:hypothetical protein
MFQRNELPPSSESKSRGKQVFWLYEVLVQWMGEKRANAQALHTDSDNGGRLL